ncbi:MAG: ABC transporter ATP-binding protein [Gammaproteobacteria bacterium HGW-Gammaproteobacteria-1]|jgi:ATP-binding cassette subfamily F protein 3|nr:MAG: ABC transporter ATP-binding protein [Gammaproteobacteria bacterium HGW-Gammaproteobacteria-1]
MSVKLTDISLRRGARLLLEHVDLTLHAGQKVGLVGANGCGKSSLFALLRGLLTPDAGDLALSPRTVIAHVAQETPAVEASAVDYVMDGDSELRAIQHDLAAAEQAGDGTRQAELLARLENIDGYTARARAGRLLHGLGFTAPQEELPVTSFSGGWRMRLNLAQALMCRSDLLLLDEPTNHLDLDAVLWLEEWLRAYPGTLILISHDRDFLDAVVHHIVHIERQRATLYAGNYSDFELLRAEKLALQQSAYEKQQREVAHIKSYVDRFRAQATKARQAQSRLKALARMELIAPAHVDSPFHFSFREPHKVPALLLRLDRAGASYGERTILGATDLTLAPGDRIGLLGPNGAGKSTLIKMLAGDLAPRGGERLEAQDLRIGYFAQHQLEQLHGDDTPLRHLQRLDPKAREQELRDFLGGFGFGGEQADALVAPFSGGEKARLVLALLVYQRPNLLLLDEPTNHLDLEMRHALTLALQDYNGAMVVVSHDRHLLRSVTDRLLLVADGRVENYDGDLDDYRQWLAERRTDRGDNGGAAGAEHSAAARKERRRQDAEQRQKLQPLRKELQKLEGQLDKLNQQKAALQQQLAEPALYEAASKEQLKALLLEQARLDQTLGETEERWLTLSEELEAAQ